MKIHRRLHLAAYDVSDAKRLRAALHITRRYATGGQKSVHECWVTAAEKGHLIADLSQVLDEARDRLLILRLDPRQTVTALGRAVPPADPEWFYIG
ncbi:CRISPR-associated protein Cas2 [Methylomarinovum tepidoasis]|uniref:CRISPR-associated endoribonuclease Cas2 n=1 Tax=Methylomarinovum tepidoasis TaxID=2840183 RepID=A0AAU9CDT0_9GAMM|nr:CRISPR-associated endonuclease Cas2 [Methylomarinovum sp. IN45]BCX88951.1 CRISPR-associated protein Cas2 [Methylomarinovum sp. IN45]